MAKKTTRNVTKSREQSRREQEEKEEVSKIWIAFVILIGFAVGFVNYQHIFTLFENDKHFSHLADFEREMAYRTEMGLYYSYYKTIINAPSFLEGLDTIIRDTVTEHGHQINTLNRFNLYPEVILAFLYRPFRAIASSANLSVEMCWQVNRGANLEPVESCEGIGNPHYFYNTGVFLTASTVASSIFWIGVLLSNSIFGGLLAVLCFFFNHGEATRVQWTPPLRESFAFPFIIAHILAVSYVIKFKSSGFVATCLLLVFSIPSMLFWQFSQFAFFTQICSLCVCFSIGLIPENTLKTLVRSHLISFIISFILLFGNEMMITTLYFPSIIGLFAVSYVPNIPSRFVRFITLSILFAVLTISLKLVLGKTLQIEDDAHIFDILRSKFTSFANFHTRLYTCSAEFDFIQYATVEKLTISVLIPSSLISIALFSFVFLRNYLRENGEIVYNLVQMACYTLMAVLIMRLKLFMTPHLCISVAVLANYQIIQSIFGSKYTKFIHYSLLIGLISILTYKGLPNIQHQLNIKGEYSNPDQEMLFDWIKNKTAKDAVFAGTMPVMANVKLSTLRSIVNHPHYEHVGIRERTLKVYSMFSKKPIKQVHETMKQMGVNYFIFQLMNCSNDDKKPECVYRGMWDEEDPSNKHRTSLCDLWILAANSKNSDKIAPFKIVYNRNRNYIVLKV